MLCRTLMGITIGNSVINCEVLRRHFCRIPHLSSSQIDLILRPDDSQNVPYAIDLKDAIRDAVALPRGDCSPTELQELQSLEVLSEVFSSFADAFLRPDWSLTEQLTSLSKFAHIIIALF